ncbi:MAG: substrate-binding domain-containing protein [Woeseiaceae bacterium]
MLRQVFVFSITIMASVTIYADSMREHISIVGSSTVYPFAEIVAEKFSQKTGFKKPKIVSTGSGFGLKLFCSGVGNEYPDITNASRAIKKSEITRCNENGIKDIIEVKIGYDGITIANDINAVDINFTLKDIFLALAKEVPSLKGRKQFIANPYKSWKEVNSSLPDLKIEVFGPPPTSGTRDAFEELVMEGGCKKIGWIKNIKKVDKKQYKNVCHTLREDGVYIEAGENDDFIVQKLIENPNAFGIFGYSFLDQNRMKIKGSTIESVSPKFDSIASGIYPISRPLYFYVKKEHLELIPGIHKFLKEFTSEKAFGEGGYLSVSGLIPMPKDERKKNRNIAVSFKRMK